MFVFGGRNIYGRVIGWNDVFGTGDETVSGFELENSWGEAIPIADGMAVLETQKQLVGRKVFDYIAGSDCPGFPA